MAQALQAVFIIFFQVHSNVAANEGDRLLFPWLLHREVASVPQAHHHRGGRGTLSRHDFLALVEDGSSERPVRAPWTLTSPQSFMPALQDEAETGPSALLQAPTDRLQMMSDMGRLEAEYEVAKMRESKLRQQLLDEAMRLQAAEQKAAAAQKEMSHAEARARFLESGFLAAVGLVAMLVAGALLYSPKRKPPRLNKAVPARSADARDQRGDMNTSPPRVAGMSTGELTMECQSLDTVQIAIAETATMLSADLPELPRPLIEAPPQIGGELSPRNVLEVEAIAGTTVSHSLGQAGAVVDGATGGGEAVWTPRANADRSTASNASSVSGDRCEYFTLMDEHSTDSGTPSLEEQEALADTSNLRCCFGRPSSPLPVEEFTAEDSWWSHPSPG